VTYDSSTGWPGGDPELDDAPTQQLPVAAPLPGPLNPAQPQGGDGTQVLSVADIFAADDSAVGTAAPAAPVAPAVAPALPRAAAPPRDRTPAPPRTQPVRHRVQRDAATAATLASRRTRDWITAGDNGVVLATILVALLLILAIGALS
jgi:hypothetical protein